MRVLIIGASGMLGNSMVRVLSHKSDLQVYGTLRSEGLKKFFEPGIAEYLLSGVDVEQHDTLVKVFTEVRPDLVVNCVGLVKQLAGAEDPLLALSLNAMFPHRLAHLCKLAGARLVQISTDCVFSGRKGGYRESDVPDAEDIYGRSKLLGEVDYPHTITLRTSIIGHELQSLHGLVGWFLSQEEKCNGFTKAIFSGFPTVVLAQIVRDVILSRPSLSGIYHVASQPISKFNLLKLVADVYEKTIEILPSDQLVIDRSLNAELFREVTGYVPPDWPKLIEMMHNYR